MSFPTIHRIITAHDENGKAIVSSQGRLPTVVEIAAVPGMVFHEVRAPLAVRQQSTAASTQRSCHSACRRRSPAPACVSWTSRPKRRMFWCVAAKRPRTPSRRSATWRSYR
jgi:hypothetical protein